jgi:hypothetical protein
MKASHGLRAGTEPRTDVGAHTGEANRAVDTAGTLHKKATQDYDAALTDIN